MSRTTAVKIPAVDASISHPTLLVLTALLTAVYFAFSFASTGFYQHDEIGHFLGMLAFWHDPQSILGNWAKFGYKILYAVPALGGATTVKLFNCLFAAGSCYLVARVVELRSRQLVLAAFCLTATQPLWVDLAFRNYSEIPTAFLLILAYFLHVKGRLVLSMLCISYICTMRQEFLPLLGLYGLDLLRRKHWAAAFSGIVFPLVQHCYGVYFVGDPLYLVHQLTTQSSATRDAYPRQGFDHYFLTCMVVFGPVAVTLLVHYVSWSAITRRLPDGYLMVPIVVYFLMHCLMNWQGTAVGPSNGGNLRYMLVISPLIAVAGTYGLIATTNGSKRFRAVYWLAPLLLVTYLYLNYKTDMIKLTPEGDSKPALGVLMASAALLLAGSAGLLNYLIAAVVTFTAVMTVKPIKLSEEDQTMQDVAHWYTHNEQLYAGRPVYVNHAMFFYWLGRSRFEFTPSGQYFDLPAVEAAPKGSIFFWDSHYSNRSKLNSKSISYEYFLQRPSQYTLQEQLTNSSQTFTVIVFEKN